jgi:hypothetical protein
MIIQSLSPSAATKSFTVGAPARSDDLGNSREANPVPADLETSTPSITMVGEPGGHQRPAVVL